MYKRLNSEQRHTTDVPLRQKNGRKGICEAIKISQSILRGELKRNNGQRCCRCKQAQTAGLLQADNRTA